MPRGQTTRSRRLDSDEERREQRAAEAARGDEATYTNFALCRQEAEMEHRKFSRSGSCDHQLAPMLLLHLHRVIQGDDGALHPRVIGRLSRAALQPEAG